MQVICSFSDDEPKRDCVSLIHRGLLFIKDSIACQLLGSQHAHCLGEGEVKGVHDTYSLRACRRSHKLASV